MRVLGLVAFTNQIIGIFLFLSLTFSCSKTERKVEEKTFKISKEDSLKVRFYLQKAYENDLNSSKRQLYLDSVLSLKPNFAYLWQQKAMPLYKARKYSLGKPFLAKAVFYNPQKYLDYSAFMKCIFSKEYQESISEFTKCKLEYGDSYVMDHTYNFYIGLNYLQLNKFEEAKMFLLKSKEQQFNDFPKESLTESCHYLDWFYLGVVDFELGEFNEAIKSFDASLKQYVDFADATFFKAKCLVKLGRHEEAEVLFKNAQKNSTLTFNEDNAIYEVYPYQVFRNLSVYN